MGGISPEVRLLSKSELKPFVSLLKRIKQEERLRIFLLPPDLRIQDEAFKRLIARDSWWFVPPLIRH